MTNKFYDDLTDKEKKILDEMYGNNMDGLDKKKYIDSDKEYNDIIREKIGKKKRIDITTIEDNSPKFKDVYNHNPTLVDRYVKEVEEDNEIEKAYQKLIQDRKDVINMRKADDTGSALNPTIDEFTDMIRRMREDKDKGHDPFIYWR